MSGLSLDKLLKLVGTLDDRGGEDSGRARFRDYLRSEVSEIGALRDYADTCLRESGPQYSRALQDIVNRLGEVLGFEVTYGRYQGSPAEGVIGYDGHWQGAGDHHIVVEVKTTDAYVIKTATLLGYINELVSDHKVPQAARKLGLYVVGRPDASLAQLENSILAEGRVSELRVISVDSLLSLAELSSQYEIGHDDILSLLYPTGPRIDPAIDLMTRMAAQSQGEVQTRTMLRTEIPRTPVQVSEGDDVAYYLTPINWKGYKSPFAAVRPLLEAGKYAFAKQTPSRGKVKPGDRICFYGAQFGVFADACIASYPEERPLPELTRDPAKHCWTFDITDLRVYENSPVAITAEIRAQLDAFGEAGPPANWAWLVQSTSKLTEHDYRILTKPS